MEQLTVINSKVAFGEGPVWYQNKLYYVEYAAHKVTTWDGNENSEFWGHDGTGPSAIIPTGTGDFYVACHEVNSIAHISSQGKTIAFYDKDINGDTFTHPNDFTSDIKNGIYFTASGSWELEAIEGKIFYINPQGIIMEVADDLHYSNGLVLSLDGKTLYCAESEAHRIVQFTVKDDGSLINRRLFMDLAEINSQSSQKAAPDGIKMDSKGNLYIALYDSGRILVVTPDKNLLRTIDVPSPCATNLALSPDEDFLYVTAVNDLNNSPYLGKVYKVLNK